jgi:hypothetical protein
MANKFLNPNWVSMEILRLLLNKLVCAEYFNRSWERDFNKEFAPGSSIQVKFPQQFIPVDGMGFQPQGLERVYTTMNLDQWVQIGFEWDDYEAAVKLERSESELRENYWDPAAAAMGQEIDSRCAKFAYQNASNIVGVLGTDPTSISTYHGARQVLMEEACPTGKRAMLISSSMMNSLGSNITTFFNPTNEVAKAFKEGYIGGASGFEFFESNSLYSHTAGTWQSTVSVNGAGQSGTSLNINCTSGDTFKIGDKFSIASVNRVNRMTRRVAGKAVNRTFTITQDVTTSATTATIYFLPAIYGPGSAYQNVDALPADTAAMTLWPGTTSPNGKVGTVGVGLTRFAFGLVGAKLYLPTAVEKAGQAQDPDTGISVRKVKQWDGMRSVVINRMDSLFGMGNLYQANGACCVVGA